MPADNVPYPRQNTAGTLYLVATPIGNLEDITRRAVSVLQQVDLVAAEDTRHSQRLLNALAIQTRMISYHEHNEEQMTDRIMSALHDGQSVALISDAGTPLVSDPGYRLVSRAHEERLDIVPVPGACAAIAALSACGLPTDRFSFEGFPPARQAARKRFYSERTQLQHTMVFYESCHRVEGSLDDMLDEFGADRRVCYCRELTKTFETIRRDRLGDIVAWVHGDPDQRKGEIVIVVQGSDSPVTEEGEAERVLAVLLGSLPVKQAASLAAELTGDNKNRLYKRALELKDAD